jgi:Family of unknown function (DUF572).
MKDRKDGNENVDWFWCLLQLLENRTKQSKQELELLESLEELRDLNRRQRSVDYDKMLSQFDIKEPEKKMDEMEEEEDEKFVR